MTGREGRETEGGGSDSRTTPFSTASNCSKSLHTQRDRMNGIINTVEWCDIIAHLIKWLRIA